MSTLRRNKYGLVKDDDKMEILFGRRVYRIIALCDIPGVVKKGELGGWVESEYNLSQEGSCWIYPGAAAIANSRVQEDAIVRGGAVISGDASVSGKAVIGGTSIVTNASIVRGSAQISGDARIFGSSMLDGKTIVVDALLISTTATGNVHIEGGRITIQYADLSGSTTVLCGRIEGAPNKRAKLVNVTIGEPN